MRSVHHGAENSPAPGGNKTGAFFEILCPGMSRDAVRRLLSRSFTRSEGQGIGIRSNLFAGPAIGVPVAASVEVTDPKGPIEGSGECPSSIDSKEVYASPDVTLDFGAGIEVPVAGRVSVFAEAWYALGLAEVVRQGHYVPFLNIGAPIQTTSTGVMAVIGCTLPLGD